MIEGKGKRRGLFNPGETKSTHMDLFRALKAAPDATSTLDKALLLLCTPRCGSTLFSEALNNSGQLGMCEEWLNYDYFDAYMKVMDTDFELSEYMTFVARKSIRDTGVYCLKMHVGQLVAVNQDFGMGIESMEFDRVIYLYRRDKIAQAVSLAKAQKSDKFRSYEPDNATDPIKFGEVVETLSAVVRHDRFVQEYMMDYVDESCCYEEFQRLGTEAVKPHPIYNRLLEAFGKQPQYKFTAGRLKKQADYHSEMTAKTFKEYITGERDALS